MFDAPRYRRSLLAYPSGVRAGFDPAHPASQGIGPSRGVSFVSTASGLVSVPGGVPFTVNNASGTQTGTKITSAVGPSSGITVFSSSSYSLPGQSTAAISAATFSGIFYTATSVSVGETWLSLGSSRPAALSWTGPSLAFYNGMGTPVFPTTVTLTANTPYFFATSGVAVGAVHAVVVNLKTGQAYFGSSTTPNTLGVPSSNFVVGNADIGGSSPSLASFAAGMWTPVALSMPQLRAWAQDPWAFWYPRRQIGVAPSSLPSVSGTLVAAGSPDIAAFLGTFTDPPSGVLVAVGAADIASFVGNAAGLPEGTLFSTEAPDSCSIVGTFIPVMPETMRLNFGRKASFKW